jgi:methionine-S-sulfoxide reductase
VGTLRGKRHKGQKQMDKTMKLLLFFAMIVAVSCQTQKDVQMTKLANTPAQNIAVATFGGGCFWCMEPPFDAMDGVLDTKSGYMGGTVANPTYDEVSSGTTGHTEVVQVKYDSTKVSYDALLETFWRNIDPTAVNRQFADRGTQYRTAIFYHSEEQQKLAAKSKADLDASGKFEAPVATEITKASDFWVAEEYHQDFYMKNSIYYQRYKKGSGRADYLKETWGD